MVRRAHHDRGGQRDRGQRGAQVHREQGSEEAGPGVRQAGGAVVAHPAQMLEHRTPPDRPPHPDVAPAPAEGNLDEAGAHERDHLLLETPVAELRSSGGHEDQGVGAGGERVGVAGGERLDGHAAHGMTGEHGVAGVEGVEDGGQVVADGLHRGAVAAARGLAVPALIVEGDGAAGGDETVGDGGPHLLATGPSVDEDDERPAAGDRDRKRRSVGGGDGERAPLRECPFLGADRIFGGRPRAVDAAGPQQCRARRRGRRRQPPPSPPAVPARIHVVAPYAVWAAAGEIS